MLTDYKRFVRVICGNEGMVEGEVGKYLNVYTFKFPFSRPNPFKCMVFNDFLSLEQCFPLTYRTGRSTPPIIEAAIYCHILGQKLPLLIHLFKFFSSFEMFTRTTINRKDTPLRLSVSLTQHNVEHSYRNILANCPRNTCSVRVSG